MKRVVRPWYVVTLLAVLCAISLGRILQSDPFADQSHPNAVQEGSQPGTASANTGAKDQSTPPTNPKPLLDLSGISAPAAVLFAGFDAIQYAVSAQAMGTEQMAAYFPGFTERVDRCRSICSHLDADAKALCALATLLADDLDTLGTAIKSNNADLYIQYLVAVKYRLDDIKAFLAAQDQVLEQQAAVQPVGPVVTPEATSLFNSLTYLTIDPSTKEVTFHGTFDPEGPGEPVPYAQLLAAALRLPPESGPAGVTGSIPGFSLEPIQNLSGILPDVMARMRNLQVSEIKSAMQNDEAADFLVSQALGTIKANFGMYFSTKNSPLNWQEDLDRIEVPDDLGAFIKKWSAAGLISPQDKANLRPVFESSIWGPMNQEGGLMFLPPRQLARVLQLHVTARPAYYGVEEDTELAHAILDADVSLKTLTGPRGHELAKKLPFHQTLLQWQVQQGGVSQLQSGQESPMGIIQVQPGQFKLGLSSDNHIISIDSAEMQILVSARALGERLSPLQASYARFVSDHFDDYAHQVAPLWNIREVYKVVAAARLSESRKISVATPVLDTSWRAPQEIESEWEFAGIGMGPGKAPTGGVSFLGGVGLQISDRMQVSVISDERRKQLLPPVSFARNDVLGHATGYPIANDASSLGLLDEADVRANLEAMSPEQLAAFQANLTEGDRKLSARLEASNQRLGDAQFRASGPPDLKTWGDVLEEKMNGLPFVEWMAKLGKEAAADLDEKTNLSEESAKISETAERLKQLNEMREWLVTGREVLDGETREKLNQILGLPAEAVRTPAEYLKIIRAQKVEAIVPTEIVSKAEKNVPVSLAGAYITALKVGYEASEVYSSFHESKTWSEGVVKACPHAKEILEEIPANLGKMTEIAKAYSSESAVVVEVSPKLNLEVQVAAVALDLSLTAIDLKVVNDGARRDKAANNVLLAEALGIRDADAGRLARNRKVQAMAAEVSAQR